MLLSAQGLPCVDLFSPWLFHTAVVLADKDSEVFGDYPNVHDPKSGIPSPTNVFLNVDVHQIL